MLSLPASIAWPTLAHSSPVKDWTWTQSRPWWTKSSSARLSARASPHPFPAAVPTAARSATVRLRPNRGSRFACDSVASNFLRAGCRNGRRLDAGSFDSLHREFSAVADGGRVAPPGGWCAVGSALSGHSFHHCAPGGCAVCPVFPGNTRRLHWPFEDPAAVTGTAEAKLAAFRMVRDQIQARVREFVTAPSRSRF